MLDDSTIERKIEDRSVKASQCPSEPKLVSENVQLNVDQHSYGEQAVTDNSNNVPKNCYRKITMQR